MSESEPPARSVVPATQGSVGTDTVPSNATLSGGGRGGRGRGRGGRSGRGHSQAGRGRGGSLTKTTGPVFKGNSDGLKGNVFQCHGEQNSDKQYFLKTVGVLDEYINKTFVYPQDVASLCKTFEITPLFQPPNLAPGDIP